MEYITDGEILTPGITARLNDFRAVVYARTSTKSQAAEDKISIPDQVNWARQLSEDKGWKFIDSYVDKLPGDIEFDQRPEGARLLEDAKFKLFNLVLFYHSSRLAREPWVGLKTISILGRLKIKVYIRNAPIEPAPLQSFMYGGNIASEYMNALSLVGDKQENIARSERVRSGFRNLAERGILVAKTYGFKKISEIENTPDGKQKYAWHFEEKPAETAVVKRMANEFLGGGSLRGIAKKLIKDKVPSPTGKLGLGSWTPATIRNILTNPAYNKKVRWGRKLGSKYQQGVSESGKQKRVFAVPDKWIITEALNSPKIFDYETWKQIQERIRQRGKIAGRKLATDSMLPGLVYCGECGRRAICKTRKYKKNGKEYIRSNFIDQSYYRGLDCRRHLMSAKKLEHLVLAKLQTRLNELQVSDIEKLLLQREKNTKQSLLASLKQVEKQLRGFEAKQSRLMELYLDGAVSRDEFDKQKQKVDSEQEVLIKERMRIQVLINDQKKLRKALKTLRELLEMFTKVKEPKVKKEMIQRIIDKVLIYENHIEIIYKYGTSGTHWLNVNPHPCGYFGDAKKPCTCLPGQILRYQKRVSGPILDRIDIHVEVPSVETQKLIGKSKVKRDPEKSSDG